MAILDYTEVQALSRTSYHLPLSRTTYHSYHFQEPLKFQNFQAQNLFSRALKNWKKLPYLSRSYKTQWPPCPQRLTHCCAWPAEGRSVLHIQRSWPAIQAAPTDRPVSSSNCCSQFLCGRPGGRFQSAAGGVQCGLLLTVEVPAKQVCSPVGDRCVQIMNDVCQQ